MSSRRPPPPPDELSPTIRARQRISKVRQACLDVIPQHIFGAHGNAQRCAPAGHDWMPEQHARAGEIVVERDQLGHVSTADEISPEGADENSSLRCGSVASVSAWGLDAFEF